MPDQTRNTPPPGLDGKTLVLQAADLVQVIGETVSLKKRGRSWIGLCPFHNEKTPSFHVHPDNGYYYCFGCKATGNAIDFVMQRDRMEFGDALRQLADKYSIELPKLGSSREGAGVKQLLLDSCSAAASYFEQNLWNDVTGKPARDYLYKRGFNDETIKRFRIGVAIDAWDELMRSPLVKKFTPEQLHQAGLLKQREGENGFYDTFRHRLMFPIRDETGRVIAFGGRVMPGNDSPAKYLNSPETPLFSKSRVCYGLDLGRQRVVETKTVAVVEGYTDVVMAHQYGATNVISVLGTALTEQHVNLLRRFADRIVLLFDGDAAGDLAVERALQLFLTQPIEIAIATLPDGQDPDEYLLQNGQVAFDALLANAEDALSFQWRQLFAQLSRNENDLTGRSKAVEAYLDRLSKARSGGPVDPIRWGSILARVSKFTEIPTEDLNRRFKMSRRPQSRVQASAQTSDVGGETASGNNAAPVKRGPINARRQAERWILGALLHAPHEWSVVQQVLDCADFMSDDLRPFAEWYWQYQRNEGEPALKDLAGLLDHADLKSVAFELANEMELMNNHPQTLTDCLQFMVNERDAQGRTKLLSDLRRTVVDTTNAPRDDSAEIDALRQLTLAAAKRSKNQA